MSICLSVWLPAWLGDTHERKHTPRYQSSPTPASCLFLFFWLPLAPLALPLPPNTNKSIFLRPAGDEPGRREAFWVWWIGWGGGRAVGGCIGRAGRAIRWRLLPAEKVAIEQPRSLRAASGGELLFSCFFSLQLPPPKKTAFLSHDLYPVVSTQDHIKPTCEERRVTRGCWPQGEGGTDQA